jgi:hypothetical protein
LAGPGKRGRKKGGHNSKPRKDKGRSLLRKPKVGHGPRKPTAKQLANILPHRWKPGQTGNPLKKNVKHTTTIEVHKVFNELLQIEGAKKAPIVVDVFAKLYQLLMKRGSVAAARAMLDWGIGSPAQTVKIMPAVDINIGLAPDIEQPDLLGADNVAIDRGEEKGNGNGSSGTPAA